MMASRARVVLPEPAGPMTSRDAPRPSGVRVSRPLTPVWGGGEDAALQGAMGVKVGLRVSCVGGWQWLACNTHTQQRGSGDTQRTHARTHARMHARTHTHTHL
jgi:hypothetical protein